VARGVEVLLSVQVSGQLHLHENPTAGEGDKETAEANQLEHHSVELGHARGVGLVQHDKAQPAQEEHEGGRQALHDVLAVDAVLHEGHRPRVPVLVGGRSHGGRFDDDVIDDASRHQEV